MKNPWVLFFVGLLIGVIFAGQIRSLTGAKA